MTGLNPLDWYGGAFLALYAGLFFGAIVAGMVISSLLRPEGRELPTCDEDELAVLAGGRARLAETVVARLLARGDATVQRGGIALGRASGSASSIEREVTQLSSPAKLTAIQRRVAAAAHRIEAQLVSRGLLMERGEARRLGLLAAIPLLMLMVLGVAKYQVGVSRDRPVGFLTVFLIVTAIVALIRIFATDRRTKAGIAMLKQVQQRSQRLKRAPSNDEMGTAVALYGTAILVGSPLADFHRLRQGSGGDGADSGSSSGGDGGGCGGGGGGGGGGCGGCGGGG